MSDSEKGILSLILFALCLCGIIPALYLLNSGFVSLFLVGFLSLVLITLLIIIVIARR